MNLNASWTSLVSAPRLPSIEPLVTGPAKRSPTHRRDYHKRWNVRSRNRKASSSNRKSSRRSLIHNAPNQLDAGASVDRLTVKLGLRRDEVCLLDIGRRAAATSGGEAAAAGQGKRLIDQLRRWMPLVRVLHVACEKRVARVDQHRRVG